MHEGDIPVHIKLGNDEEGHPGTSLLELAHAPVHPIALVVGAEDGMSLERCGVCNAGVDRFTPCTIHQELKSLQALLPHHDRVDEAPFLPPHFVRIVVVPRAGYEELERARPFGRPRLGTGSLDAALWQAAHLRRKVGRAICDHWAPRGRPAHDVAPADGHAQAHHARRGAVPFPWLRGGHQPPEVLDAALPGLRRHVNAQ
mmetsp:Transcript_53679/g.156458  ORF Transcript_53679/g.156458 Transcript_53679/m.156458 type:complete len:201 (-) Transcript_53679:340-942(-)